MYISVPSVWCLDRRKRRMGHSKDLERLRLEAREPFLVANYTLRNAFEAAQGVNKCAPTTGTPAAEMRDGGRMLHELQWR